MTQYVGSYIGLEWYENQNTDRIFLGASFGMPFGIVGIAAGSLFAFVFNKVVGSDKNGKKAKRSKRAK